MEIPKTIRIDIVDRFGTIKTFNDHRWAYTSYTAHQATGQKRKFSYEPYYYHPFRVAQSIFKFFSDNGMEFDITYSNCMCAAYLHDVVEDTHITLADLKELGVNEDSLLIIENLTDQPIDKVLEYDYSSCLVKFFDIQDNINCGELLDRNNLLSGEIKYLAKYKENKIIQLNLILNRVLELKSAKDALFIKIRDYINSL